MRRRGLAFTALTALLPVFGISGSGRTTGAQETTVERFWGGSYGRGSEQALASGKWLFVLFPSPFELEDPAILRDEAFVRRVAPRALGARVRAREVRELARRFEIDTFPACVLVDPHGRAVARWEGDVDPRALYKRFVAAEKALSATLQALESSLEEARTAFEKGDLAGVISAALEMRKRSRSEALPPVVAIEELIGRVRAELDARLLAILAREGIDPDAALKQALRRLARELPLPEFVSTIEREIERLDAREIGGA